MSVALLPDQVVSFPGARVVFTASYEGNQLLLSNLEGATVEIYFPGEHPVMATIHETNNTFSWIIPITEGTHKVRILVSWDDTAEWGEISVTINPVMAAKFTYRTGTDTSFTGTVHADIYNPLGQLVHSAPMTQTGMNYEITHAPPDSWFEGEYRIAIRDDTGIRDVDSLWIERPMLASMGTFFGLPPWQRQVIEYLKYEMMGDTDPLHPGAIFTLEEYSKHWSATVEEINNIMPYTDFRPQSIPLFWANVTLKGTLLRVYHALANRSVTIPRWNNLNSPIQDESHYQGAWEQRYNLLRPEYVEERNYMKGAHLPNPAITVDPFLGWIGGNLAGTSGLALIGRPSWFGRMYGGGGVGGR